MTTMKPTKKTTRRLTGKKLEAARLKAKENLKRIHLNINRDLSSLQAWIEGMVYGNVPVSRIFDAVLKWDLLFGGKLKHVPICDPAFEKSPAGNYPLEIWMELAALAGKPWEVARRLTVQELVTLANVKQQANLESKDAPEKQTSDGKNPRLAMKEDSIRPPLTTGARAVLEVLQGLKETEAMTGKKILDALANKNEPIYIDQSTLTTRIIPALKAYGVQNKKRLGYFVRPLTPAKPEHGS